MKLGEGKVYSLAYADDLVLLAEGKDEMKSMMERLERYLDKKRLELNASKSKIMRFRKGGRRMEKREWRWVGKLIEEVKEFRYLGYMLQRKQEKRKTGGAREGENKKGEWVMEDREKEIREGLGKENVALIG